MKIHRCFLILSIVTAFRMSVAAQQIDIGIFNAPPDSTLEIKIRPTANYSGFYSSAVFTIRWLTSLNISIGTVTSSFGVVKSDQLKTSGSYSYQTFAFVGLKNVNWTAGQQYLLATIVHNYTGGSAVFELTNTGFAVNQNGGHYQEIVTIGGAATGIIYSSTALVNNLTETALIAPPNLPDREIALSPSPATDHAELSVTADSLEECTVSLIGVDGKIYLSESWILHPGHNEKILIFDSKIPGGQYFVQVRGDRSRLSSALILHR